MTSKVQKRIFRVKSHNQVIVRTHHSKLTTYPMWPKIQDKLNQIQSWWLAQTEPKTSDPTLMWRGYLVNSLILGSFLIVTGFLSLSTIVFILGLDNIWGTVIILVVMLFIGGLRYKTPQLTIDQITVIYTTFLAALVIVLSLVWGVNNLGLNTFCVTALAINALILKGRPFQYIVSSMLVGYMLIGFAQFQHLYTPSLNIEANIGFLYASATLTVLAAVGYMAANFIDRVLTAQVAEARRSQELASRIIIATELQVSMLPPTRLTHPQFDIAGISLPSYDVGGDFYSYHLLGQHGLAVTVGDVTGKGVPAALLMAVTTGIVDSLITLTASPAEFLATVSQHLWRYTQHNRFNVACVVAFLQPNQLIVANGGCVEPILRRVNGETDWIGVGGLPLGISGTPPSYQQMKLTLMAGDILVFTSDGAIETKNEAKQMLSFDGLLDLVKQAPTPNAQVMQQYLLSQIQAFQGAAEQHDDITIVVIKVNP